MKKTRTRTCFLTREQTDKDQLIRITKFKDGSIELDLEQNKEGRGLYFSKEVLPKILKTPALKNKLGVKELPEQILNELKKLNE